MGHSAVALHIHLIFLEFFGNLYSALEVNSYRLMLVFLFKGNALKFLLRGRKFKFSLGFKSVSFYNFNVFFKWSAHFCSFYSLFLLFKL